MTVSQERTIRENPGYVLALIERLKSENQSLQAQCEVYREALKSAAQIIEALDSCMETPSYQKEVAKFEALNQTKE